MNFSSAETWSGVCDHDLGLCLDRSSDSDHSQLALSELIDSITCDDDGEESVVADVVERLLDRVEGEVDNIRRARKHVRRKPDHEVKNSRRRSTSTSTTSSACSDESRKHRRKHHRRKDDDPSPRVNPIFLWVKQDDTRIVEVLCEDYDKRNRIRLTKTAQGWRATPRTERLDSARSLDLSPPPPQTTPQTKEKKPKRFIPNKPKLCDRSKDKQFNENTVEEYNNVDVVNNNNASVSDYNQVDTSIRHSEEPSLSEPRLRSFGYKKACHESLGDISKSKQRDNNMLQEVVDIYTFVPTPKTDWDDNNGEQQTFETIERQELGPREDTLEFPSQPSPLTALPSCPETVCTHSHLGSKEDSAGKVSKLNVRENDVINRKNEDYICTDSRFNDDYKVVECTNGSEVLYKEDEGIANEANADNNEACMKTLKGDENDDRKCELSNGKNNESKVEPVLSSIAVCNDQDSSHVGTREHLSDPRINSTQKEDIADNTSGYGDTTHYAMEDSQLPYTYPQQKPVETETPDNNEPEILSKDLKSDHMPDSQIALEDISFQEKTRHEPVIQGQSCSPSKPQDSETKTYHDTKLAVYNYNEVVSCIIDSSTPDTGDVSEPTPQSNNTAAEQKRIEGNLDEEDTFHEIILPEPHLHTPEPSPQPVPEPSTTETEDCITSMSLQPDTSLDSYTMHLPDTTTKSETSLLISNDISLDQRLSNKHSPELEIQSSLLSETFSKDAKRADLEQSSGNKSKTATMNRHAELERQISADLDEDHLLAIEEILQGEDCVEDFDLPDDYSESHESPVNLVIDLKAKDQVDNIGIPLSLRTDVFLEMFPTPSPVKDSSEMLPPSSKPIKKTDVIDKPIPPAHQQTKPKFLESILSYPKSCHVDINKKSTLSDQQEPLYLGVSRKSASPTVSSSDGRKFSSPELEPNPKRMKIEDITLKTILNKSRDPYPKTKVSKVKDSDDTQQTADSTTKSRLLELLTNENEDHINKLDPLTQLKEVLSDPDLNVPDPLLVARSRLPALVANPGKEIPRLIAMKTESLYPKLLTDPDLLVVSLSHLQSLLQATGKEDDMLKYQQHAHLLQQQMKQEQATLDAATAAALNQMMWLPYLNQLEAAAIACGNSQELMAMLNSVYPQINPYLMTPTSPSVNAYDYKSQLEFQQAFALWNEAMMQAATNQFAAQTLGATNNLSKLYGDSKYKQSHSNAPAKQLQDVKHASARTSPISLSYQQNKYRSSQFPYQSVFSIPTSTPASTTNRTATTSHSYRSSNPTNRGYSGYGGYSGPSPKLEPKSNRCTLLHQAPPRSKPPPDLKSLSQHLPSSTTMVPSTTVKVVEPPKLKVRQHQHLVDPHSRPRLLNVLEEHAEVGSTTGSHPADDAHHNLWHPLFSSHQQKSYSSPWQWTTPVTVSGE